MVTAKPLPGLIVVRPSVFQVSKLVDPQVSNQQGEVVAIGEGVEGFELGELVLHQRFAGSHVELNGEVLCFLDARSPQDGGHILAHLEESLITVPSLIA